MLAETMPFAQQLSGGDPRSLHTVSLTADQQQRAVGVVCDSLDQSSDWIVLNTSLQTLAVLARRDSTLTERLLGYLKSFEYSSLTSLARRSRKLLAEFDR